MKKYLIILTAVLALAFSARAQQGVSLPFIGYGGNGVDTYGPGGNMLIPTKSTNSYNTTNVFAKGYTITNTATSITNSANGLVINGYVSTVVATMVTNTSGIQDVILWANRDGTAPIASIGADIYGASANFTNIVTFNFAVVPTLDGNAATAAQNLWSFSVTGNGTNDVVISTNLPTALLQGNRKLRLSSVASTVGTNNGDAATLVNVWLNGYKPAGND